MSEDNPLELVTTADLIGEINGRFDACVIVTFERRTGAESETSYYRKGDVMTAIGLHETAKQNLMRGGSNPPVR